MITDGSTPVPINVCEQADAKNTETRTSIIALPACSITFTEDVVITSAGCSKKNKQ
jgi:hypothetical protein